MRTRFLASVAVVAAALLAPSAALADPPDAPTLAQPTTPTAAAPVDLSWNSMPGAVGYRVFRAAADCTTGVTNISDLAGGDVLDPITTFQDNSPSTGTHCYFVRAFAGITEESLNSNGVLVTYDQDVPTGSLSTPIDGAFLSTNAGPIVVTSTSASDATSGVASVQFFSSPNGLAAWTSIDTASSGPPYSVNWSPVNGIYDLYAIITDNVGHTAVTPTVVGVVVDNTAPTGTLSSPGAVIHGTAVNLDATAGDTGGSGLSTVEFQWSQHLVNSWTTFDADNAASSHGTLDTTTLLGDGLYDLRVKVTDRSGNIGFSSTVSGVRVDNTAPATSMVAPATSAIVHGNSVPVSATASDAGSGVTSVTFEARLGAGSYAPIGTGSLSAGSYSFVWNSTGVADGLYSIHAIATDGATLTTTSLPVTSVRVDNTAPSVTMTAPASSTIVHGNSVAVSATASDTGSGVTSVTFEARLGAGSYAPIGTGSASGGTYSFNWNTTGVADGVYSIHAIATDGATLTTTSLPATNVTVDNTAPVVTLGGVADNDVVHASVPLTATPLDSGGSGVASVTFGRRLGTVGGFTTIGSPVLAPGPYAISFTSTGVIDGYYDFQAQATDAAGNPGTSTTVTHVLVDNHAPAAPGAPTGLTPVSAAPTIVFNPSNDPNSSGVSSGVDHYDVYRSDPGHASAKVNAGPILETGAGSYTWSDVAPQSSDPASGTVTYTYKVLAVDKAGNASALSGGRTIVLDPTASSAPGSVTAAATPTSHSPQLTWLAPSAPPFTVDHYNVYRGAVLVSTVVAPTASYTDTPLSADGTYTYQVVAAASDGTPGVASAPVTVTYDTTAPGAPGGVAASAAPDGSVGINWTASSDPDASPGVPGSGVARYVVRRALSSTPPATVADGDATCQGTATSCSDATALNGKLYSYAVFAVDRAGNTSPAGASQGVTARDQTPPAVPKGLSATPGDRSVSLSWAASAADDDVAGYVLVAKQGALAPTSETDGTRVCSAIVATSAACTASGLTNGATYTFGLFALDEALNRSQPAVVSAAPNGHVDDTKAPAAVTKLHAKVSGHTVTLTWKNPSDSDFDHVLITAAQRKPSALKASKRVYSGKGTKVTTKLAAGQSRWFVVVAYDDADNASAPASVHASVAAVSPFGPAPRARVHGKVRLTWPVVKGARYYNVQIYSGKKRIMVSWPAHHALVLPHKKLHKGRKYTWYVWPGLGAKRKAHYGKLIGKNVFTFAG